MSSTNQTSASAETSAAQTPGELMELLEKWNATGSDRPPVRCLHEAFEARAREVSTAEAVVCGRERLTYGELNSRSNRLAHALRRRGVGSEVCVGICLERTPRMLISILGVLKAGGTYVPLDPDYPRERVRFMLEDSGAPIALAEDATSDVLADYGGEVLRLDTDWTTIAEEPADDPPCGTLPGALAYVIYTSGSTGRPKGVAIAHQNAAAMVGWAAELYGAEELSGFLASTSICFDLSVYELFLPLSRGGKIILASDALELPRLPAANEVRLINTVPSAIGELVRSGSLPQSVVTVNLAGEPLMRSLVDRIYDLPWVKRVYNLYGPSEDTTYSTWALIDRGSGKPPIGRPIRGSQAWVLGADLLPTPIDEQGELYLAGAGVTRGYLGRPALTAERYVPDPFAKEPGGRLYRTGDLARWWPSGELEFLGRVDHQVKVRGFRIELGEIEARLSEHPALREVVVVVREDVPGFRQLVAYLVAEGTAAPPPAELREHLSASLPDYMVPGVFVVLDEMPLTPNGKIDRRALPEPKTDRSELAVEYRPPATPVEETLTEIWQDLLSLGRIGVDDNLFELGAHSLLAAQMCARVRETMGIDMMPAEFFHHSTVARLAVRVEELRVSGSELPPIQRVPRDGRLLPLSFPQKQIFFINKLVPGNLAYNFQYTVRLKGVLDREILERTLTEIVRRHELLCTTFEEVDGKATQVIHEPWEVKIDEIDLTDLEPAVREARAEELIHDLVRYSFDVTKLPLMVWTLLKMGPEDHYFVQAEHHFVHDGWSVGVLLREIAAIYEAFAKGQPSPLPELPIQFADFAAWQHEYVQGEVLQRQLDYWREQIGDSPTVLDLPSDRPRPRELTFRGARLDVYLPPDLYRDIRHFGRREGYTLFVTMLAAFEVLLHRISGRDVFLLASGVANRRLREIEPLIGMVVNTIVLRADLRGDLTFRQLLDRVRDVVVGAQAHQDLPFDRLVEELQPDRDLSRNPIFQHMFSFHDSPLPDLEFAGLTGDLVERHNGSAKADFNVIVKPRAEQRIGRAPSDEDQQLKVLWEYSTDLFDASTIDRYWGQYQELLRAAVADPDVRISRLSILTAAEREQLAAWNRTEADLLEPIVVHRLFEDQVDTRPDALAVAGGGVSYTYRELDERANRLAHSLRRLGVGPEVAVGVAIEGSPDMAVAILAALKAGGAYLPLDPGHPPDRLLSTVEDSQVPVVLTREAHRSKLEAVSGRVIALDADWPEVAGESADRPQVEVLPDNLAYVIYTSGSTGRPKGTELRHTGLNNLVAWHRREYDVTPADRGTQIASPAFDASVWELWPYLTAGASLHFPAETVRADPPALYRWLADEKITLSFLPTPLAEVMLEEDPPAHIAIRALLVGGDKLQKALRRPLPYKLVNHYGPTEDSVVSTFCEVKPGRAGAAAPPIGHPISNTETHLLDRALEQVPLGVPGELCVAGIGLARGYLRRPSMTAERFMPHPLAFEPGARIYRTGDLARWLPSGEIEFLGRIDFQVKVRGFHIELGEIEAVLGEHPGVGQAVVVAVERTGPADKRLAAYYVPSKADAGSELATSELESFLEKRLPNYMVPVAFVALEALPLTPNGKVDRDALPAPEWEETDGAGEYLAPRTAVEEFLAETWAEVLGRERIGVVDDFFKLGGHSILAVQMFARLRDALDIDLPLQTLFEAPTLGELASAVEERLLEDVG